MKLIKNLTFIFVLILFSCKNKQKISLESSQTKPLQYVTVLGVAQDAGFPQIDCSKLCCEVYHNGVESKKLISCLGLVDLENKQKWIFDATPDFTQQVEVLKSNHLDTDNVIDGVFLTHAHIGHYTGLMYLGFEAMGAKEVPVYAMTKMKTYLETNGPWSQLVSMNNIKLRGIKNDFLVRLNENLKVCPFLVPHRDEYSETVGFKIEGNHKSILFIPDINKWRSIMGKRHC